MRRFRIRRIRIQRSRPRTASISAGHRPSTCPHRRGRWIINSQCLVRSLAPPKIILEQFRPVGSRT
jgi:hypothetical protein